VPFIDHTLLEFCARIPTSLKLRRGEKKYLLKEAARPFIPESVLTHRKQGFASPMAIWLRGGLKSLIDSSLSSDALNQGGVLNAHKAAELVSAHHERRSLNDKHLFALLMFQRWWTRSRAGSERRAQEPAVASAAPASRRTR